MLPPHSLPSPVSATHLSWTTCGQQCRVLPRRWTPAPLRMRLPNGSTRPNGCAPPSDSVDTESERCLEVMLRVGAEGHMSLGGQHPVNFVEPVGDDVGDLLVIAHPHHRD